MIPYMGSRVFLDARSLLILFSYILLSNWIRRGHYWLENAIWSYFTSLKVQKAAIFEVPVLFLNSACQRQKGVWTCCSSIWIKHVVCFINLIYKLKLLEKIRFSVCYMCLKWHPKYGIVGPTGEGFFHFTYYIEIVISFAELSMFMKF